MLEWKANLQSNSQTLQLTESNNMDVEDVPNVSAQDEIEERQPENDRQTEDERIIDELLRSNLLSQAVAGGSMTDPLCKKLGVNCADVHRPKIPYSEFVNEVINNGTYDTRFCKYKTREVVRNFLGEFLWSKFVKIFSIPKSANTFPAHQKHALIAFELRIFYSSLEWSDMK